MTERRGQRRFGFLRNLLHHKRNPADVQREPAKGIDFLNPRFLKRAAIEKAKRDISALTERERSKLVDETRNLTFDLITELLSLEIEDRILLKFAREGERIIIFPDDPNHPHREFAVVNEMFAPEDAGMVRADKEDNCLYLYDESVTLEIYPNRNHKDQLARQETLTLVRQIIPGVKVSGEFVWKL